VGIAASIGSIIGTQAIRQPALLIVLVTSLTLIAIVVTGQQRSIVIALVAGTAIGAVAGCVRIPSDVPALQESPRTIIALVASDPKVERNGSTAWVEWTDGNGVGRRSLAQFTSTPSVGRGDTLEALVTGDGVYGERLRVRKHRVVGAPGRLELFRRAVRERLTSIASARIPGSPGTLTLGLLIGDDSALPRDERLALRRSGLSHITAVSGWNVTLVTGSIGAVFLAFRLRGWFWVLAQVSLMGGYVWIVGLDPPVARAAIMAVVALSAARLGRPSHSITAMSLAAAIMVMLSPEILSSLSFQLSVLATFALIAAMRVNVQRSGWKGALTTSTLASTMTGIATAPVLATAFGTLSLATVPANILAGPLVPIASVGGLLVVLLEIVPPLSAVAGWVVWILCSLVLIIARSCAAIPFGYVEFTPLDGAMSAVIHLLVIASIAVTTPDGRFIARRLGRWTRETPREAAAAGIGMAATLVTAIIVM
jgi:ComEC/Rec2-related protein